MHTDRVPTRALPVSRIAVSPAVLLLVALTVQIAVGGPVLAAQVVRHEVATERDGFRRLSSTVVRAIQSLVAVAPGTETGREVSALFGSAERAFGSAGVVRRYADHGLRASLIDLPPPSAG